MTLFPVFLLTCAAAGTAGAFYRPGAWYRTLDKPDWTPPNWPFPVMWAVLYVLIALAATRVSEVPGNDLALGLWGLQITIKSLWSRVFFRTSPDASGGADHRGPWGVVLATTVAFWALDVTPSLMMVPYLIWGTYALALNTSVWLRNRDRAVPRGVAIVSRLYRVYSDQVGEGFAHYAIAGSSGLQYRCHDREVDEGDADRQEQRHD